VFDPSLPKLLVLAVLALIVFGPHELPKISAQADRALRNLRRIADGAKADLRGTGPGQHFRASLLAGEAR
jgi:sec-independent protein translocase protein TatB